MNINTSFFVCFRIHIYRSSEKQAVPEGLQPVFTRASEELYAFIHVLMYIYASFYISFYTSFYSPYWLFFFPFDLVLRYILFDVIIRKGAHAIVNGQGQIKQRKDRYCPGAFTKTHIAVKKYRNIDRFEKHSGRRFL